MRKRKRIFNIRYRTQNKALNGRPLSAPIDFSKPNCMKLWPWETLFPTERNFEYHKSLEYWLENEYMRTCHDAYKA